MSRKAASAYPPPRLIFWEVTVGCNLACLHCRAEAHPVRSPLEFTLEECYKFIHSIADWGDPVLVLTGGEPLYRPDIFDIISCACDAGLAVALASNGTMIDQSAARKIAKAGVQRVAISLDGSTAEVHDAFRGMEGSFNLALQGFEHLKRRGVSVQINSTIAQHNVDRLEELFALAEELEADALHAFLLVPVGCGIQIAEEHQLTPRKYEEVLQWLAQRAQDSPVPFRATCAPHYYRILKQRGELPMPHPGNPRPGSQALHTITKGCLAGSGVCFVSHQGDIQPCGYLPLAAGNVRETPLPKIWRTSELFASLRDPEQLHGKCAQCEYVTCCSGCRARAYYHSGDYLGEEPFCVYQPRSAS